MTKWMPGEPTYGYVMTTTPQLSAIRQSPIVLVCSRMETILTSRPHPVPPTNHTTHVRTTSNHRPTNRDEATRRHRHHGLAGVLGAAAGAQDQTQSSQGSDEDHYFENNPEIEIPVIDGYHDGEKVWFIHTSVSTKKMAKRLTEMIDYPTLHVPKLDEIVNIDALADIYVFKNGVDRSDAQPWGGGPFGF